MNEKIKTLSLFAGIGGIDLGLEATGYFETVQFVEYDPYCQHILKRHWPDVPIWGDVKTFDPDSCGEIDCIVGGFPCQPFSVAGKQKGTQDDRHLWPRMFEIIKHKRPSLILCENVSGHIVLGLDEVLLDLEGEGYSTRAFVIPASAVDANHKRERVWIVAYANTRDVQAGCKRSGGVRSQSEEEEQSNNIGSRSEIEKPTDVANTDSRMRRGGRAIRSSGENKQRRIHTTQEKQTSHDIRSKTIGCDTVRGEAEDVANTESSSRNVYETNRKYGEVKTQKVFGNGSGISTSSDVPNTQGKGLEGQRIDRETSRSKETGELDAQSGKANVSDTNSQRGFSRKAGQQAAEDVGQQSRGEEHRKGSIERRLGGVVDGVPSWLHEPDIPRVTTNQTGRVQRLKMLGNAVVPQVVYQLGLAMKELWDEV